MVKIRYLRNENNVPWATIVGLKNLKQVGYSICCDKDHFSKRLGRRIALIRAINNKNQELPKSRNLYDDLGKKFVHIRMEMRYMMQDIGVPGIFEEF